MTSHAALTAFVELALMLAVVAAYVVMARRFRLLWHPLSIIAAVGIVSIVVSVLGEFANSAVAVRASAEIVLTASQSVESAIGNLRDEVESFLSSVTA